MAFFTGSSLYELPPDIDSIKDRNSLPPGAAPSVLPSASPKVVILGTGDFGRALASRFLQNGYEVVIGSRSPGRRNLSARNKVLADVPVLGVESAVKESEIILLAVPGKHMVDLLRPVSKHLAGKVLVDVSNNSKLKDGKSHAEELAEVFTEALVVKAFNTISAYALQSSSSVGDMEVKIASNSPYAREVISGLARDLGLQAVVFGGLRTARELEKIPVRLWRGWGKPVLVTVITWFAWGIYGTWRYHYKKQHDWSRWPTNTNNKIMGCTAFTLLAFCFLPGSLAAVAQLIYGTKHRAFPSWLSGWLNMRKQLGLLALWLASVHCVLSVAHLTPAYFGKWYDVKSVTIPLNQTKDIKVPVDFRMNWIGETAVCCGTMALAFMVILGITSLPSVGSRLNWRQWTFIQSHLGHVCLIFALAHVSMKVMPYIWWRPFLVSVQGMSFLSTVIPYFTLIFRLILLLPCFSIPIWKIRSGWERGVSKDDPENIQEAGVNLAVYTNHAFSMKGMGPKLDKTVAKDETL